MFATIMTCRRPGGVNYLPETRDSLTRAGLRFCSVVTDGPTEHDPDGVRLGIVPTFRRAVMDCHRRNKSGPAIVFQDDIDAPPELGEIVHGLTCRFGVYSLFLSPNRMARPRWTEIPKSDEYPLNVGACGIVMDAATARQFLDSPPFPRVDRLGSQLVQWCWRESIPFFVHSPSLLRHTGEVSAK